jgi:hypothetical protein
LRRDETRHGKLTPTREFTRAMAGKVCGRNDRFAKRGSDLFQTRRQVDRRPDASEIEAVTAADIAVHHLSDVKRKAKAYRRFILDLARQFGDAGPHFKRAAKRATANSGGIVVAGNGKNRQQSIAHELEHLAAVTEDRGNLAAEIAIKNVDHGLLGKRGKSAHVRKPDCGTDRLDITAPDFACENPLSGLMSDVGVNQVSCGSPQRANFCDPCQGRDDRFEIGKLFECEAARMLCRPRGGVDRAVNKSGNAA